MSFLPTLGIFSWLILLAVPPAIISLYFLKLKRQPLEVPSTYLWTRAIEDLHVNSIWQRLRQSLLLLLQLLVMALIILACLNFGWRGTSLQGDRFVFLIDTSASMNATDGENGRSRLDEAKRKIGQLIERMKSGDQAMLISFSNTAKVEQSFTDSRSALRDKLNRVKSTRRDSDIHEALVAAAGLANPGQTGARDSGGGDGQTPDIPVAEAATALLYVFSDGGFESAQNFDPGHLAIEYVKIGSEKPHNVGIVSFTSERNPENPEQTQAFARLENFSPAAKTVSVALYLNDDKEAKDVSEVTIPSGGNASVKFDLLDGDVDKIAQASFRLVVEQNDDFPQDNVAYAALNVPHQARVLLVTAGNEPLRLALGTEEISKIAVVSAITPDALEGKSYQQEAASSAYDFIIYDRCAPKNMPNANTLFIGVTPKTKTWTAGPKQGPPLIYDTDKVHRLTYLIEMSNVSIIDGFPVTGPLDPKTGKPKTKPPGGTVLIDSDIGSLLTVAPRDGYHDAVLGFEIFSTSPQGETLVNTNWHVRRSFPMFVKNAVEYLGGARSLQDSLSIRPGKSVVLRTNTPVKKVYVTTPLGSRLSASRGTQSSFTFVDTEQPGIYQVREGAAKDISQHFAVNLFDSRESDIRPKETIPIGYEDFKAQQSWQAGRSETWKWLLFVALGVLLLEWYIFNRRVYL